MSAEFLNNKVVVITGSTRGLGLHLAREFSTVGSQVVISGRHQSAVESVCREQDRFFPASADLLDETEVAKMVSKVKGRFGRVDLLICNAGGGRAIPANTQSSNWNYFLDLNLRTCYNSIEHFSPLMSSSTGESASICVIGSVAGLVSTTAPLGYSVSKGAICTLVRRIAPDLAKKNIRINSLVLGNLMYEGSTWAGREKINGVSVGEFLNQTVPLRRFGTVQDVFSWCVFLASKDGSFATGSNFVIDGGQSVR